MHSTVYTERLENVQCKGRRNIKANEGQEQQRTYRPDDPGDVVSVAQPVCLDVRVGQRPLQVLHRLLGTKIRHRFRLQIPETMSFSRKWENDTEHSCLHYIWTIVLRSVRQPIRTEPNYIVNGLSCSTMWCLFIHLYLWFLIESFRYKSFTVQVNLGHDTNFTTHTNPKCFHFH